METKKMLYGKGFRIVVSLALFFAVLLAVESPIGAVAASVPHYIGEMVTFVGDSYEETKAVANQNGYEIMKDPIYDTDDCKTFIAYKTTTNPHKAIKKIKALNMYGNWSYDEYNKFLKDMSAQTALLMDGLEDAIAEYASMYKGGKPIAVYKYYNFFYQPTGSPLAAYNVAEGSSLNPASYVATAIGDTALPFKASKIGLKQTTDQKNAGFSKWVNPASDFKDTNGFAYPVSFVEVSTKSGSLIGAPGITALCILAAVSAVLIVLAALRAKSLRRKKKETAA